MMEEEKFDEVDELQKQIVSNNIDFKNVSKFEEKGDP
jgi:hypothetical protein